MNHIQVFVWPTKNNTAHFSCFDGRQMSRAKKSVSCCFGCCFRTRHVPLLINVLTLELCLRAQLTTLRSHVCKVNLPPSNLAICPSTTLGVNLTYDEMLVPCDYNFSVPVQWRSDEPQSNPSPEDHSLIQPYHHFVSLCMREICVVWQPAISSCVVTYLQIQQLW